MDGSLDSAREQPGAISALTKQAAATAAHAKSFALSLLSMKLYSQFMIKPANTASIVTPNSPPAITPSLNTVPVLLWPARIVLD